MLFKRIKFSNFFIYHFVRCSGIFTQHLKFLNSRARSLVLEQVVRSLHVQRRNHRPSSSSSSLRCYCVAGEHSARGCSMPLISFPSSRYMLWRREMGRSREKREKSFAPSYDLLFQILPVFAAALPLKPPLVDFFLRLFFSSMVRSCVLSFFHFFLFVWSSLLFEHLFFRQCSRHTRAIYGRVIQRCEWTLCARARKADTPVVVLSLSQSSGRLLLTR